MSLVRTALLCCALFLAAHAGAPSLEEEAAPAAEPAPEIFVARGDGNAPTALFVPFRCAGSSRSSGDLNASAGALAEPSREPAVARAVRLAGVAELAATP